MTETLTRRATMDDLLAFDGKAELIGDRIVELPMPGDKPSRIAFVIAVALELHIRASRLPGEACGDGRDFAVGPLLSRRRSFRPDCSYYVGRKPANPADAIPGAPTFAVEVRSKDDHTQSAEREMADKRSDYFEAGTVAVWDVNPETHTISLYLRTAPETPVVFRSGEIAHAGPAVPGWAVSVDSVFA